MAQPKFGSYNAELENAKQPLCPQKEAKAEQEEIRVLPPFAAVDAPDAPDAPDAVDAVDVDGRRVREKVGEMGCEAQRKTAGKGDS